MAVRCGLSAASGAALLAAMAVLAAAGAPALALSVDATTYPFQKMHLDWSMAGYEGERARSPRTHSAADV